MTDEILTMGWFLSSEVTHGLRPVARAVIMIDEGACVGSSLEDPDEMSAVEAQDSNLLGLSSSEPTR